MVEQRNDRAPLPRRVGVHNDPPLWSVRVSVCRLDIDKEPSVCLSAGSCSLGLRIVTRDAQSVFAACATRTGWWRQLAAQRGKPQQVPCELVEFEAAS